MASDTKIEWATKVWNPVRGCSRVSEGCRNCYAERQAMRFSGPGQPYEGLVAIANGHPQWTGKIRTVPEAISEPTRWRKPQRVFVNSMSDLFHPDVPQEFIEHIFGVMKLLQRHSFLILTKRPALMKAWCDTHMPKPLPNVWLGVSVEDQTTADERIPLLLETPAAVRWVSYEPALSLLDLFHVGTVRPWKSALGCIPCVKKVTTATIQTGPHTCMKHNPKLDWVVTGGESGPGARPAHPDWFRRTRDDCQAAGVPFFSNSGANMCTSMIPPPVKENSGKPFAGCSNGRRFAWAKNALAASSMAASTTNFHRYFTDNHQKL